MIRIAQQSNSTAELQCFKKGQSEKQKATDVRFFLTTKLLLYCTAELLT